MVCASIFVCAILLRSARLGPKWPRRGEQSKGADRENRQSRTGKWGGKYTRVDRKVRAEAFSLQCKDCKSCHSLYTGSYNNITLYLIFQPSIYQLKRGVWVCECHTEGWELTNIFLHNIMQLMQFIRFLVVIWIALDCAVCDVLPLFTGKCCSDRSGGRRQELTAVARTWLRSNPVSSVMSISAVLSTQYKLQQ